MVVQAYILIQTESASSRRCARDRRDRGVTMAEDVTVPYDVIVRAEARNVASWASSSSPASQGRWDHPHADVPGRSYLTATALARRSSSLRSRRRRRRAARRGYRSEQACAQLLEALPDVVSDAVRRDVDPASEQVQRGETRHRAAVRVRCRRVPARRSATRRRGRGCSRSTGKAALLHRGGSSAYVEVAVPTTTLPGRGAGRPCRGCDVSHSEA